MRGENIYFKRPIVLFFVLVVVLTFLFNFRIIDEIFSYNDSTIPINDGVINEFITETEYQNILDQRNPFAPNQKILYPFGSQLVFSDTSATHLPFLLLLRPFLDVHRITLIILMINIVVANMLMYVFLRRMNIRAEAAMIGSLVFGFAPFLSYRVLGHNTYTAHYIFPMLFLAAYELIVAQTNQRRSIISVLLGAAFAVSFYANPYYFIMVVLGMLFTIVYAAVFHRKKLLEIYPRFISSVPKIALAFFIVLFPWISQAFAHLQLHSFLPEKNLVRSAILSADVFSFFSPGEFNPIYMLFFSKISKFFFNNWDSFAYPGVIILLSFVAYFFLRRDVDKDKHEMIHLFMFLTCSFIILTLGPFLKIFNHWFVTLEEAINAYFPLPYLVLTYIPLLNVLTVPSRFIAAVSFFGSVLTALMIVEIYRKFAFKNARVIFIALFAIFLVDQMYIVPYREPQQLPLSAYQKIKNDPGNFSVLEVPLLVRDGLQYSGDVHATGLMAGGRIHQKPFIGGYFARVEPSVFSYYKGLPFIGHILAITDEGNYHLYKEEPRELKITQFRATSGKMREELNFLDVKYIILRRNEPYSNMMVHTFRDIGYREALRDSGHILFEREPVKKDFTNVVFGEGNDYLYAGLNIGVREDGFRWATGKSSTVFFKTYDTTKSELHFEMASFFKPQSVKVYVNDKYAEVIDIHPLRASYKVPISRKVIKGINTVTFVFSSNLRPSDVLAGSVDVRRLSAKIYSLEIKN